MGSLPYQIEDHVFGNCDLTLHGNIGIHCISSTPELTVVLCARWDRDRKTCCSGADKPYVMHVERAEQRYTPHSE